MAQPTQNCIHNIEWKLQHAAIVATNGYPSGAVGVIVPGSNNRRNIGEDVYVRALMGTTAGTLSMTLSLYGRCEDTGDWYHLADLGSGAAITVASQGNSSSAATNMYWMERVAGVGGGFTYYYVRVNAIGGTNPTIAAHIGFSVL